MLPVDSSSSKAGRTGELNNEICLTKYLFHISKCYLTCREIYDDDGFTSPPKNVGLRIFIVPKSASLSAGFEPANLGCNGKHASH
jgi:hypothetical protein